MNKSIFIKENEKYCSKLFRCFVFDFIFCEEVWNKNNFERFNITADLVKIQKKQFLII